MRLLSRSVLLLTLPVCLFANADGVAAKKSLMEKLQNIHHFSAKFSQQVFDNDNKLIQQGSGTIVVSKPNKVHWQTLEPEESLIVSDGTTLWLYDPFIEQASAFSLAKSVVNTPILLLTNESAEVWDQYQVNYQENNSQNQNIYEIQSIDEQSQVKSLVVSFQGEIIQSLLIHDATGQKSEITLTDNNYQAVPNSELFNFSVPEGVYLDDQR